MLLYMHIAPGQGQTTPWGQNVDVNRKALSLCPFSVSFKNIFLHSDFMHIFLMFFPMYIAPTQGQTTLWGKKFDANRKTLSLSPFVASYEKFSFNSDFMHLFNVLSICI